MVVSINFGLEELLQFNCFKKNLLVEIGVVIVFIVLKIKQFIKDKKYEKFTSNTFFPLN